MSPLNAAICTTISYTLWVECCGKICHESKYLQAVDQSNYYYSIFQWTVLLGFFWIIWPWDQRSRFHKGHYSMQHTALWSCTHITNIIDLSGKTKKLWSGQASLRRSQRKNQTKTMSPFVQRGDINVGVVHSNIWDERDENNT